MKKSGLCLTTNATEFGYPFIESIKSFLPVVDEMIVIDGGSTDKTIEMIKDIRDPGFSKIRIVQDDDVKWEKEWAYWRMDYNLNRGLKECQGDIIIRFDVDMVLHEDSILNFESACKRIVEERKIIGSFQRMNFPIISKYHIKKPRSLVINKKLCDELGINVAYGLEKENPALSSEPIIAEWEENKMKIGRSLIKMSSLVMNIKVFSYSYAFSTQEQIKDKRTSRLIADIKQSSMKYKTISRLKLDFVFDEPYKLKEEFSIDKLKKDPTKAFKIWRDRTTEVLQITPLVEMLVDEHPEIMRRKINKMAPEQQGYSHFGKNDIAFYFILPEQTNL